MDEGGDSETCLALTALSIIGPLHEAEKSAEAFIERLIALFRLPDEFELHGVALLRDARLKDFQREFVLQQALDFVADLSGARVFSLYWDWYPDPPRSPGDAKAHRIRRLYHEMLNWLQADALNEDYNVAEIVYDKLSAQPHLEREHNLWVNRVGGDRILVAPRFDDSRGVRLLQLVDIAAHATHLAARRRPPNTKVGSPAERSRRRKRARKHQPPPPLADDPARVWYAKRLKGCFPASVAHSGIRDFTP